jgi:predicted Rossmann-fold nucleotide-binding protein
MTSRLWQMTDIVDVLEAWEARQSDRRQSLEEGLVPILINDPKHWRRRAKAARAMADELTDPRLQRRTLRIAEDYEDLAKRAEKRLHEREGSSSQSN